MGDQPTAARQSVGESSGFSRRRKACSYSALRACPVISAASRTAVLTGNSCSKRRNTRSSVAVSVSAPACGCTTSANSPRVRCAELCNQAGNACALKVAMSSNCLVSSRPTVKRREPNACNACARDSMRCGASSNTCARGSCAIRFTCA